MPELPEVECVVRAVAPRLEGRRLRRLSVLDPKLRPLPSTSLRGRRIAHVERVGKTIAMRLDDGAGGSIWLGVHLRMTGKLVWASDLAPAEASRVRARFELDEGGPTLLFVDVRRFGTIRTAAERDELGPAGIDPFAPGLTARSLHRLIAGSRQALKVWLMRQDRLVGLGNIYASEILHEAGLHPALAAGDLGVPEAARLFQALRRVLRRAIRAGGTTISDYRGAGDEPGRFQTRLRVYGREGEPCRRCGAEIVRTVAQARSTYHCPGCQPLLGG